MEYAKENAWNHVQLVLLTLQIIKFVQNVSRAIHYQMENVLMMYLVLIQVIVEIVNYVHRRQHWLMMYVWIVRQVQIVDFVLALILQHVSNVIMATLWMEVNVYNVQLDAKNVYYLQIIVIYVHQDTITCWIQMIIRKLENVKNVFNLVQHVNYQQQHVCLVSIRMNLINGNVFDSKESISTLLWIWHGQILWKEVRSSESTWEICSMRPSIYQE